MFRKNNVNGLSIFQFSELESMNNIIIHAFTYRNLNFNKKLLNNQVFKKNCNTICNELELEKLVICNQNHTNNILIIKDNKTIKNFEGEYFDAIITNTSKTAIAVFTADCQPILLYDTNKNIIAVVHSGWRGTLHKIVIDTVNRMISEFGCNTKDIICAIGPAIQKCHFEVEEDVWKMFANEFGEILDYTKVSNKYFIDAVKLNIDLLVKMGIGRKNILDAEICTVCSNDMFYSYRAEKEAAR